MKYLVSFCLHAKGGSADKYLECRLKWEGSRKIVALSMGYRVDPSKWIAEAQRCRPNSFHGRGRTPSSEINAEIERYVQAARAVFSRLQDPTREEVATAIRSELGRRDRADIPTVMVAYWQFCAEQAALKAWTTSTLKKMHVTGRHIEDSALLRNFHDITPSVLAKYLDFLRQDLNLSDVTAHRQIANLRWFLTWSEDHQYLGRGWRAFKPKFRQPDKPVIFLEWDELMRVWAYEGPARLMPIRDMFVFCAFTSLRYSDAHALTWSDVGPDALKVTTVKTYDALTIELNKWSREILERRRGKHPLYVFPRTSNQAMNRGLKEICKACGIDRPIRLVSYHGAQRIDKVEPKWALVGTHAARRTFVVNALQMGISPTTVMQWTGHSDYKAMKTYIAVADSARARAMSAFDALKNDPQ